MMGEKKENLLRNPREIDAIFNNMLDGRGIEISEFLDF